MRRRSTKHHPNIAKIVQSAQHLELLEVSILVSPFRSKARLEAEIAMLRQQLIVLQRKSRGRVRLTDGDRSLFVQLYRWFPYAGIIQLARGCSNISIIRAERRKVIFQLQAEQENECRHIYYGAY
jgi:hypothetical protein